MIAIIGIGVTLVIFAAVGNATAPHIARWLIKRCAVWYPEPQRQDFEDESFDLIDSYNEDGRKLQALLIGLTEFRRTTWSFGLPSRLLSERSDRLGMGLVNGLVFGLVLGLVTGVEGGLVTGLGSGLVFGLATWLISGLVNGFGSESDIGLVLGLVTGLVTGLVLGLATWLGSGLVFGLFVGILGFTMGFSSWFAPLLGRRLMRGVRRRIPQP